MGVTTKRRRLAKPERRLVIQDIESGADIKFNLLVYGVTGVGKTRFVGTAHECEHTEPLLLVDIEGGALSLSGTGIKIVRPTSVAELQDIYDFLRHDNQKYRSVAVDSLTELQRKLSMGEIMGTLDEDQNFTNLADHTPPDRYAWLSSSTQMRKLIAAYRELAYLKDKERRLHVIFTALEKVDEQHGVICPQLPGILGLDVGAAVDVLCRMSLERVTVKEKERTVRKFTATEFIGDDGLRYLGKARTPPGLSFPDHIWQPTVAKVIGYWIGETPIRKEKANIQTSRTGRKRRKTAVEDEV